LLDVTEPDVNPSRISDPAPVTSGASRINGATLLSFSGARIYSPAIERLAIYYAGHADSFAYLRKIGLI